MTELPIIGQEYTYLGVPVEVLRIIPLEGHSAQEAEVEFKNRVGEYGTTKVMFLQVR
jgi:hypothetical protein